MFNSGFLRRKLLYNRFYLIAGIFACFIIHLYLSDRSILGDLVSSRFGVVQSPRSKLISFLYDAVQSCEPRKRPDRDSLRDLKKCIAGDIPLRETELYFKGSYENLQRCLHLTNEQLQNLKSNHAKFVQMTRDFLSNDQDDSEDLFPREAGIVTVGGGKYSVLSLLMIEVLREKGSRLPVEVIIPPSDEGDYEFCSAIENLNARCVYFSDVIPEELIEQVPIKGYQIKVIALLISSFKRVLFLDADNIPLANPDPIFEQPIVQETGLILWPDIWKRVTPPAFYKIAGVDIDMKTRVRYMGDDISPVSRYQNPKWTDSYMLSQVPMHDFKGTIPDPTSESGQLFVDKTKQLSTLLLAAYYNFNAEWYFHMLSQGTSGEGDKETFIAAAHVLKEPYYQVKTGIDFDGFFDEDGSYHGICLYHFNPQQDYDKYADAKSWMVQHKQDYTAYDKSYNVHTDFYKTMMQPTEEYPIDVVFGHTSYHKFEPLALARERIYVDRSGQHFRGFKRYDLLKGFDLELFNYEVLHRRLCSERPLKFKLYQSRIGTEEWSDMCEYLQAHIKFLQETSHEVSKS